MQNHVVYLAKLYYHYQNIAKSKLNKYREGMNAYAEKLYANNKVKQRLLSESLFDFQSSILPTFMVKLPLSHM